MQSRQWLSASLIVIIILGTYMVFSRSDFRFSLIEQPPSTHATPSLTKAELLERQGGEPVCGDVCRYDFPSSQGKFFSVVKKEIVCRNMMTLLLNSMPAKSWPPPKTIPEDLLNNFTQNGDFPVLKIWYLLNRYSGKDAKKSEWTKGYIESLRFKAWKGGQITDYEMTDQALVVKTMEKYSVKGLRGAVLGSEMPWVEALILNAGASHVTTIEYGKISSSHPSVDTLLPEEAAKAYLSGELPLFDFIYTYSSLEHSGLGRYGDEQNPFGDLEAAAQSWCMLKRGGLFFLGLPTGIPEGIVYTAHRIYGPNRMQHMAAGFEQVDHFFDSKTIGSPYVHEVYVLRKPLE